MALDIPENATVVGRIEVAIVFTDDGDVGKAYGFEGMDAPQAIGYLTTVIDRLRESQRYSWDTCPDCGLPWDEHDLEEDDEDDQEDES